VQLERKKNNELRLEINKKKICFSKHAINHSKIQKKYFFFSHLFDSSTASNLPVSKFIKNFLLLSK
jgi:hypothetical protein